MENNLQNNIAKIFAKRVAEMGEFPALKFKIGKNPYTSISWTHFGRLVRETAYGLAQLGLTEKSRVGIFANTSHLWVVADFATIINGAVSVPIYPTCSTSDIEYILNNSEADFVFVQNEKLLAKVLGVKDKLPRVKAFVVMFPGADKKLSIESLNKEFNLKEGVILTFDQVHELGNKHAIKLAATIDKRSNSIQQSDLLTIIYTSGTTGTPKGVPLTHANLLSVCQDMTVVLPISHDEVYLSYLPMSHVFERVCGEFYWMHSGGTCAFAEGIEHLGKNMAEVKPSMMLTVPRVLDKIYSKVKSGIDGASGRRRQLIEWSLEISRELRRAGADGKKPGPGLVLKHWLAEKLVLEKLRERIGPKLRLIVSGGAPATPATLEFFGAVGITTLEGYGLTETSAPACVNRFPKNKLGTVGPTLPSVKAKLSEEGEIMVKGGSVFSGYYNNPEATKEALEDGWFKTGDIGTIDSDGYIKITDRKKDIIVNSSGKNIAPQKIEAVIKTLPMINLAVVFGDKQKYLVALLTLDEQIAMDFSRESGWSFETYKELTESKEIQQYLKKEILRRTADLPEYEQVKRFVILPEELSVENGELTATLKIKRNVVAKNYKRLIDSLYEDATVIPAVQPNFANSAR
ncbi:MAG: long-chain fatty acid--CoA ligase [Candidatus Melainabacteria bacterium]|nr:long-chain fatty acid--CoA ligase [Candidatus Melainabacteria bacterium]